MVVGRIGACKLVLHSSRYPILCENLLMPKIHWNNAAKLFYLTMFMALKPS